MSGRLAVLLRAVNVGGTGKLPMADFKSALAHLGYAGPKTLGAAGSAVISTTMGPAAVETAVRQALRSRCGLSTEVFARAHPELAAVLQANPFAEMARDEPSRLIVIFLNGEPMEGRLVALRGKIVGPETVAPGPACLYVAYPTGQGTSKLTIPIIERALDLRGTGRNWNTVGKLAALTGA